MQLNRMAIILRQRSGFEAADLGVRMAIAWAAQVYPAYLSLALPALFLLLLIPVSVGSKITWWIFAWWWLKPAFDRVALYALSRRTFGEKISLRQTFCAIPNVLLHSNLLYALSFGRFSIFRSLQIPVDLLEKLPRKKTRKRRRLITQSQIGNTAITSMLIFSLTEIILTLAIIFSIFAMFPPSKSSLENTTSVTRILWNYFSIYPWVWALSSMFLEPIYVACGFSLYIKRRSDLEAWDIEIQLRQLQEEQQKTNTKPNQFDRKSAGISMLLFCCIFSCQLFFPATSHATEIYKTREQAITNAASNLKKVLSQEEYGKAKKHKTYQWKNNSTTQKQTADHLLAMKRPTLILELFSTVFRVAAYIVVALVIIFLLRLIIRSFNSRTEPEEKHSVLAEIVGLDIRPESLPDDIAKAALELANKEDFREALSLLFRGSLSVFANKDHINFKRGDTELDCLALIRAHAKYAANFFSELTLAWQQVAYANIPADEAQVKQLCLMWGKNFSSSHEK